MKRLLTLQIALIAFIASLVSPALAAQNNAKIEQAWAKAEEQITKGKPDEAVKNFSKAADQNPSGEAYVMLARLQERLGNLDEATAALNKAKDVSASAPPASRADVLAAITSMQLLTGPGATALVTAKQAAELSPTPAALAALTRAQLRAESAPAALKTAEDAVAKHAASALVHEARGEALSSMGRMDDAVAAFRKALELDPKLTPRPHAPRFRAHPPEQGGGSGGGSAQGHRSRSRRPGRRSRCSGSPSSPRTPRTSTPRSRRPSRAPS